MMVICIGHYYAHHQGAVAPGGYYFKGLKSTCELLLGRYGIVERLSSRPNIALAVVFMHKNISILKIRKM